MKPKDWFGKYIFFPSRKNIAVEWERGADSFVLEKAEKE